MRKEERLLRQELPGTELYEREIEIVFDLPHFAARPPAVGGRIHDHRVVTVAAAELPTHELETVVHDIADSRIRSPTAARFRPRAPPCPSPRPRASPARPPFAQATVAPPV